MNSPQSGGIKPKKKKILEDTLLWKDYNTKAQEKKIGKKLFALESVEKRTERNSRIPVGLPGKSFQTKKKPKKPSLKEKKTKKKGNPKYYGNNMFGINDFNAIGYSNTE